MTGLPFRLLLWILALCVLCPLAMIASLAILDDWQTGVWAAVATGLMALPMILFGAPPRLGDSDRGGKLLFAAFVVLAVLLGLRTAGTGTFMLDVENTSHAVHRVDGFGVKHNCFTCLAVGAHLARSGAPNIYDKSQYRGVKDSSKTPVHDEINGHVSIDSLPYPPPALLITQVLRAGGGEFFRLRTHWFVVSWLALCAALACAATFAGGFGANRSLLLFPAVFLLPSVLVTFQIGNIQVLVIAFSMLAMVAFTKRWHGIGAMLLAYAILTKLWPAVLLIYLALGRRWRPVGATLGACVLLCLAAIAAFGLQPFASFVDYQLPKLASGEAFAFMKTSQNAMLANLSVFSWPHKLHALGYGPEHSLLPGTLKWSYTGFLALVVLIAGLRQSRHDASHPLRAVRTWLAILTLIQLRSPFLPYNYGVLSTLCLLVFLLPGKGVVRPSLVLLAMAVLAIDIPFFQEDPPLTFHMHYSLVASAIAFTASMVALVPVLWRPPESEANDTSHSA